MRASSLTRRGDGAPRRGQFFIGSLKFDYISRLDPQGGFREVERLAFPETGRVRDVREAPDRTLWFLSEEKEAVYRITRPGGNVRPPPIQPAWPA